MSEPWEFPGKSLHPGNARPFVGLPDPPKRPRLSTRRSVPRVATHLHGHPGRTHSPSLSHRRLFRALLCPPEGLSPTLLSSRPNTHPSVVYNHYSLRPSGRGRGGGLSVETIGASLRQSSTRVGSWTGSPWVVLGAEGGGGPGVTSLSVSISE